MNNKFNINNFMNSNEFIPKYNSDRWEHIEGTVYYKYNDMKKQTYIIK